MHVQTANQNRVVLFDLHEHPGGHDGGEFADSQQFGVNDVGVAYYMPGSPDNDSFEEHEEFVLVRTKEGAEQLLRNQAASLRETANAIEAMADRFRDCQEFHLNLDNVVLDDEEDEEEDEY